MANDQYPILPAKPEHALVLSAIARAAKRHWDYPEKWIEQWADALTLTPEYIVRHAVFIVRDSEAVVGFHAVALRGGEAQLDHLWVLPVAMGQGRGRALYQHAEEWARQKGAKRLWVESDPHAERFYRHMGMTTFGHRPSPMHDGTPRSLPLLEKVL